MHKAIITNVRGKTCLWQYIIMPIKLFGFSTFYVFLDFWHKNKYRLIKKCKNNKGNKRKKTKKKNKNKKKQTEHAIQIYNKVVCALQIANKVVCAYITHEIQGIVPTPMVLRSDSNRDHREAWWRCPPFDCLYVWIQDTQLYLPPNPRWSGNVSLCVLTLNAEPDS